MQESYSALDEQGGEPELREAAEDLGMYGTYFGSSSRFRGLYGYMGESRTQFLRGVTDQFDAAWARCAEESGYAGEQERESLRDQIRENADQIWMENEANGRS